MLPGVTYTNMLMATQWPLKRAPHLTSPAWVCVVWRSKSLLELAELCYNRCAVEVWEWISNYCPHFAVQVWLLMLGLKLNYVSKRNPISQQYGFYQHFFVKKSKERHTGGNPWHQNRKNSALRWRHNGRDCVSNHQPHDCLLNRLFGRRSK